VVAEAEPFVWDQDDVWASLEEAYEQAACDEEPREPCGGEECRTESRALVEIVATLEGDLPEAPSDPRLVELEERLFRAATWTAKCPTNPEALVESYARMRSALKRASWDLREREARDRLYRLLYGGRLAVEEVLLQMPPEAMPVSMRGVDEPSSAPSTVVHGVRVHSGDILLSRGGAPTSAMIARGNDYPGNFSHVALVHVDEEGTFRTIESHIEVGVVVDGLEKYESDPKLRVMLLRPRAGLGIDAHAAATWALEEAQSRHIAYDFGLDYEDAETMFCSEVASAAYAQQGVSLWQGLTTTSTPGVARWLASFGATHFETHGPSDLEYDPQLVVVAEWRDPETLFSDHVDNAVLDALLEGAAEGDSVQHEWHRLPLARLLKAYSWVKNVFGGVGPIPEGMSATVALRVAWLRERHAEVRERVLEDVAEYEAREGHRPPYWDLVRMARDARGV